MRIDLNLHFLGGDLRTKGCRRLDQSSRLAVELNQSCFLLGLFQSLFGIGQIVLRLFELLLKKKPALRGLSDCQML